MIPFASGAGLPHSVLFVSGIGGSTQRYRCLHAQEQLALHDIPSQLRLHTDGAILADALDYDMCILHRVPYDDLVKDLIDLLHRQGKIAIYDTDDLVFDPEAIDQIRLLDVLSPAEARRHREDVPRNRQTMLACDHVLVPTDYLARAVAALGQRASVHRNALGAEFLCLAEDVYKQSLTRHQRADSRLVIGYASGTHSHNRDFLEAADALLYLLGEYEHVDLHIFGYLSLDDRFSRWAHRIRRTPYLPWQQVPTVVSGFDVNLAPLEENNPFCQSKSELKYFIAGILGVPTVASRTDAFEFAIRHGENGFLASKGEEWLAALELLITDRESRQAAGARAREHVLQNYTPAVRAGSLISLLSDIRQQQLAAASSARPEKPELQKRVIQLQQRHLARQREIVAEMAQQIEGQRARLGQYETQVADLEREVTDLRRIWTTQLETIVTAHRRRPLAQAFAHGKAMVKKWLRLSPRITIEGRLASPGPELIAGHSQGQTFFAAKDGLHRLEILFATFGRINTGELVFHLRPSVTLTEDIVTVQVSVAALKDNQYHHFNFEPLPESAGCSYYFCLEAPSAVPGDAVSVWAFEDDGPEGWTRYTDERTADGQIVFLARFLERDDGESV
jgi:glycosyltransferase involved in cell wall biosynthesis